MNAVPFSSFLVVESQARCKSLDGMFNVKPLLERFLEVNEGRRTSVMMLNAL